MENGIVRVALRARRLRVPRSEMVCGVNRGATFVPLRLTCLDYWLVPRPPRRRWYSALYRAPFFSQCQLFYQLFMLFLKHQQSYFYKLCMPIRSLTYEMSAEGNFSDMQFTLSNGVKMPAVGLGTYRIRNNEVLYKAVDNALEAGYRLFDTAAVYQNEQYLGNALRDLLPKYGLTRQDIFITTKLAPSDLGGDVSKAFNVSLENLGLEYIDLYLIHFPGASRVHAQNSKNADLRIETWNAITKLYDQGKVRAIGVSNFTVRHLTQLAQATTVMPMVNQVEWHPHYYQLDLLQYCEDHNLRLQAYCSFGGLAVSNSSLMEDRVLVDIAAKHNATAAQVLLAWALHRGIAVIPKSTTPHRIKENIQLNFKLSENDISQIDTLGAVNCKYAWDPNPIA